MEASRRFPESGPIRRWLEALAFVGVWVAAGLLLDMSINTYLLFGIPLTAGFQLFVRKRPIKDPMMRLRLLAPILVVVFLAGRGGGEEELTAPTEGTEIVEDTTEVTQAPPREEG